MSQPRLLSDPRHPYVWVDPADAIFVAACREAIKTANQAWEAADRERRQLRQQLAELRSR